ncbi:hypothetical protein POM88_003755 [Heracleum sosnowskyi]|uniref:Agenet domain-containing protein n=1 Tax=Heracleum sosnowskyi TaxID=360622 RepID=A0AAD8JGJ9_9APIA|nr:hypothetical protein POM88_003755 [Heracleum sosnowskyi]
MHVEVTSEDDGFRGAWYVAKIIQDLKLMDNYVEVEYNELLTEDDESKKLIERVHVSFVRPLPPVGKGPNEVIEVNDVVDTFYNDGWWVGVVKDVVDDGTKFLVSFDDPPHTMKCRRSDVRVHFDWVDGNWVKPQKKQDSGTRCMPSGHYGNFKRQKRTAKRQQVGKGSASTEKKDKMNVPDEVVEKECIAEEVDMSVKEVEDALPTNNCETPPEKDQKNKSRDWERQTVHSNNVSTKGDSGLKRKRGRPPKLQPNKKIGSTGGKGSSRKTVTKDSCVGVLGDEAEISAEKHCLILTTVDTPNEDHFQPLSKDSMMVTTNEQHASGVQRHNLLCSKTEIIPLLEYRADETVKNKRIKQNKNSLSSAHNEISKIVDSESQYQECDNKSRGDSSLHDICHSKDADIPIVEILADLNEDQISNSRIQLEKPCPTDSEDLSGLPVQRQCANENGLQDGYGTPVAKNNRMEPGPLHKTDGSNPGDLPAESLSRVDSNDKGGELETPSASVCFDDVENHQSLPFLKGSPLWKNIESLEIFKKTQKKPHFSPLVKCKEEMREGLAIGHMVNFSNLVENISRLQFCDPITVIESKLGLLAELESHGFDVEKVRACLTQLLSKKQRETEFQKEYQDIGNTISYSAEEISKADEEIAKLNKRIRELSAKLNDTVSKKKMKESEISTLQSKQDVVGENLQVLQIDFENTTGTLL